MECRLLYQLTRQSFYQRQIHEISSILSMELETLIQSFLDATNEHIQRIRYQLEFHSRWKHVNREFEQCDFYKKRFLFYYSNRPYLHWNIDLHPKQLEANTCLQCGHYLFTSRHTVSTSIQCRC